MSKGTKRPSRDSEVHQYAERVRRMTDKQIWEEGHKRPTLEVVESVVRDMHEDILSILAPHFDDETMSHIAEIMGNWYGFNTNVQFVDSNKTANDKLYTDVADDREIAAGKVYRHFKGNYYQVLYMALDSEDKSTKVIYRSLDPAHTDWVFCRPLYNFRSEVDHEKYPEYSNVKWRFTRVTEVPK